MNYRHTLSPMKMAALAFIVVIPTLSFGMDKVETWDYYEVTLKGPTTGNPFKEVQLKATFTSDATQMQVKGFYNGNGIYLIRFMPDKTGIWRYDIL